VFNVEAHGFQDTLLGLLDGLAQAVYAWEIVAISIVALTFSFDCNGVAVKCHRKAKLITGNVLQRRRSEKRVSRRLGKLPSMGRPARVDCGAGALV
jgi:hypothetical protein